MRLFTVNAERLPMVLVLSGLLLFAAGLYVGFDNSLAFGSMIVGLFDCAFGLILFVLHLQERPRNSVATRLSSKFISAGSTVVMPAMPTNEQAAE